MKNILTLLFTLLSFLAFAQVTTNFHPANSKNNQFKQFNLENRAMLPNNYDLQYCRFNWHVDPAVKHIAGDITYYFFHADSLTEMQFELSDSLTVDSVLMYNNLLNYQHSNNVLTILFDMQLADNQIDSVRIVYSGVPPSNGFGSFEIDTHGPNLSPVLWTLSEPYGAFEWWPTKQDLNDKIDSIDIIVTTPAAYTVASNGILANQLIQDSSRITHWKHRYPIAAYLVAIAVSDYVVFNNMVPLTQGSLHLLNYVYAEDLNEAVTGVQQMLDHLVFFDSLYGPYPFMNEKYGHAQFNWGGGMEHQTMSFVGGFSYELLAHELAHQWWGDHITCGSWQDLWLNEGFATYSVGLCYERFSPNLYWPVWRKDQVDFICSSPDGSVFVTDTLDNNRLFDARLTYSKGAMLLHMLRWKMGSENFFTVLRNYQSNAQLSYGFARNIDLKTELESVSGQNLDEFFNDWYWGEGYPSYQLSYNQDTTNLLTFSLGQTQSHPSVSFFEMPVPIRFKNATHDTTIVFDHTFTEQVFTVALNFKVDNVIINPNYEIVCSGNTVTSLSEIKQAPLVQVYPNPANNFLTITIGKSIKNGRIEISTLEGKILNHYDLLNTNGKHEINVEGLHSGLYLLTFVSDLETYTSRFIKK